MMITGFVVTLLLGLKPSSLEGFNHDASPSPPGEHGYAVDSDEFRLKNYGHGDAEAVKEKALEDVKALLKEEVSRDFLFDVWFIKLTVTNIYLLLVYCEKEGYQVGRSAWRGGP
jgi:hypothetical protein